MPKVSIVVIGAGLQGSCIALSLAQQGFPVTLIDVLEAPMLGASLLNEGKIHLGFVYALDRTGETRKLMLKGALHFAPLLEKWTGKISWDACRSDPFQYAVMHDSLASATELESAYVDLARFRDELLDELNEGGNYLGRDTSWLWRRVTPSDKKTVLSHKKICALFETEEAAIDPRYLRRHIATHLLKNPHITFIGNTTVHEVQRHAGQYSLTTIQQNERKKLSADVVINCAWHDRIRIDESAGVSHLNEHHSYRVKYQIIVQPKYPTCLAPLTMVQGPYGDIVPWRDGSVYLSWYPTGRTYFGASPPDMSLYTEEFSAHIAQDTIEILSDYCPFLADAEVLSSKPGIIVARGKSDVHTIESELHERSAIGPQVHNNWWSVDTGKLTTAPFFAYQTTNAIVRSLV